MEQTESRALVPLVKHPATPEPLVSSVQGEPARTGQEFACPVHCSQPEIGSLVRTILLELPLDVTEWVSDETLAGWVHEEIEALDRADPTIFRPTVSFSVPGLPKALASVVCFACLRITFDGPEMPANYCSRPALRNLSGGLAFFPEDLSRFRHLHRELLALLLTRLLARVAAHHYALQAALSPDCIRTLEAFAVQRLNIVHHLESEVD